MWLNQMMSWWGERIWLVLSFHFTKFMFCMVPVFVEEEENGKEQLCWRSIWRGGKLIF